VSTPGADGLLDRVRGVVPLIAARAAEAEEQRKPADDVIDALKGTGVFRSFVPERYGGYEIDLELFMDIGVAVSEACASTGWITTFYMEHNWLLGLFDEELRREIFTAQPFILAPGTVNPSGEATPRDGGFELSGQWQYGTGVVHADWVLLSGMVPGEEAPMSRMFLIPIGEVEVKDTWHVDGMAATGSRDIVARSVFVPDLHVSKTPPPTWLLSRDEPYMRRFPMLPFLALTAAIPSIGCARRSVALFEQRMAERIMFGTTKKQAETAPAQIRLGNLIVRTAIAESTMRTAAREMAAHARGETQLTLLDHLQLRVTIAHVVRMCRDIVRDVMEASGAGAHFLDNELQRIHRDIHMISAHTVFDVEAAALHFGRERLRDEH
jgi:3-hydroxy-9,10-secoandrosta-1,3,5(10)-triene-9,17-dione monooxygenase